jgi:hypothetical protein
MVDINDIYGEIRDMRKENTKDHTEIKERLVKLETTQDDCIYKQRQKRGLFHSILAGICGALFGWMIKS